jgi:hypothetical protein
MEKGETGQGNTPGSQRGRREDEEGHPQRRSGVARPQMQWGVGSVTHPTLAWCAPAQIAYCQREKSRLIGGLAWAENTRPLR